MTIDVSNYDQLKHQIGSIQENVKLGHSFELNVYFACIVNLHQPQQFNPVGLKRTTCNWDDND
jgi:hypothetical protein